MYIKRCSGLFLVLFTCMEFYYTQKLDLLEGYACTLPNNELGICKPLNECSTAIRELKEKKKSPILCSFQKTLPVVCCENEIIVEKVKTETSTPTAGINQRIISSFIPYSENEGNEEGHTCNQINGNTGTCEYIKNCDFRTKSIRRSNWNWCSQQLICCHRKKPKHVLACNIYRDKFNAEWIFDPDIEIIQDTTSSNKIRSNANQTETVTTRFGDFQHVALIGSGTEENKYWFCAGTLISEKFVLTSARCVVARRGDEVKYVRMGEFVVNSLLRRVREDFHVRRTIVHPNYKRTEIYNDIALIELERDVVFTAFTHPACLYDGFNIPTKLNGTGWIINVNNFENNLLSTEINVYAYDECQSSYKSMTNRLPLGLNNQTQICGTKEESFTCLNGVGAPIQIRIGTNLHSVVGVTSVEELCQKTSVPNIYTRVSPYIAWIENIVWD